jgi:regulation of enolase protein 1 (concanavalin A-like superfamily)
VQWLNEPAQWSEQQGTLVVTIRGSYAAQYAQAGAMVRLDERRRAPEGSGFQVTFHDLKIARASA